MFEQLIPVLNHLVFLTGQRPLMAKQAGEHTRWTVQKAQVCGDGFRHSALDVRRMWGLKAWETPKNHAQYGYLWGTYPTVDDCRCCFHRGGTRWCAGVHPNFFQVFPPHFAKKQRASWIKATKISIFHASLRKKCQFAEMP